MQKQTETAKEAYLVQRFYGRTPQFYCVALLPPYPPPPPPLYGSTVSNAFLHRQDTACFIQYPTGPTSSYLLL